MKRTTLLPIVAVLGLAGYVTFHPGVAYAEPRMASMPVTSMTQDATFSVDAAHTSVYFDITHMGLSHVHGRFNKFSGTIVEDASDLTKASVNFTIQVESVDTAIAARDNHLRTADFFDAAKFPQITFKSKRIEKTDTGYHAVGDLTIKDKTKEIGIAFKHHGPNTSTQGDKTITRIGVMCDPITIKRSDFGVGAQTKLPDGTEALGDEVTIRLSLEAIKQ